MTRATILLTDPQYFEVSYAINPWMDPKDWAKNRAEHVAAARRSWEGLKAAILAAGAEVIILPGSQGLPDLVFPANAGVALDRRVIPSRFKFKERQGEEPLFRQEFERLKAARLIDEIVELPPGIAQEGAGDCLWDAARGHFWSGYGQRSDLAALGAIESVFGKKLIGLELATPNYYHLDTCFSPLSGGEVLFFPGAFTPASTERIRAIVPAEKRLEATPEEAALFCLNAVRLDRKIIMARTSPRIRAWLTARSYEVTELDLDPFIRSGGAAFCLTLRLDQMS